MSREIREIMATAEPEPAAEEPREPTRSRCQICGHDGAKLGMVRWADPLPGKEFDSIHRCLDVVECRARVEAADEAWPVNDRTPASVQPVIDEEPPAIGDGDVWA